MTGEATDLVNEPWKVVPLVITERMAARVLSEYEPDPNSGCWLWYGATSARGYGVMGSTHHTVTAHRVAYAVHNGPFDPALFVRHKCDTPVCINPDHLCVGTHQDNMDDKARNTYKRPRRYKRFSDAERAKLASLASLSTRRIAVMLGRSDDCIKKQRRKLARS